jgi:polyhydroxyalkanoate synthesis regulator phasin
VTDDPKVASWHELLDKTIELGLGAALLTKDAIAKLVEDLVKRGAVTREDGKKLVGEMVERGKTQKEKMEVFVAEVAERVLDRADLARRSSVEQLEKRMTALEEELARKSAG